MDGEPDVSVVVPAYDAERTIGQALDSVFSQAGVTAEVIVIDDGSRDATRTAAEQAARTAEPGRLRLLSHPGGVNRGVAASRNLGLADARAPFVAFLDADDWLLAGSLVRRATALREHGDVALVYGRVRPVSPAVAGGGFVGSGVPRRPASMRCWLLFENPIPTSTVMVRRASVPGGRLFPETLRHQVEDWAAWLAIAARAPMLFLDEDLAVYRRTPASWSVRLADREVRHAQLREEAELVRSVAGHDPTVPGAVVADALAYRSAILLVEGLGQLARFRVAAAGLSLRSARSVAGSPAILCRAVCSWVPRIKGRAWFSRRRRTGAPWRAFNAS